MSTNDMASTYGADGLIVNTLAAAAFRAVGLLVLAVTAKRESGRAVCGYYWSMATARTIATRGAVALAWP